ITTAHNTVLVSKINTLFNTSIHDFSCCWIPSHVGIDGNEKADKLAKEGIHSTETFTAPATLKAYLNKIDDIINTKHLKWWNTHTDTFRYRIDQMPHKHLQRPI